MGESMGASKEEREEEEEGGRRGGGEGADGGVEVEEKGRKVDGGEDMRRSTGPTEGEKDAIHMQEEHHKRRPKRYPVHTRAAEESEGVQGQRMESVISCNDDLHHPRGVGCVWWRVGLWWKMEWRGRKALMLRRAAGKRKGHCCVRQRESRRRKTEQNRTTQRRGEGEVGRNPLERRSHHYWKCSETTPRDDASSTSSASSSDDEPPHRQTHSPQLLHYRQGSRQRVCWPLCVCCVSSDCPGAIPLSCLTSTRCDDYSRALFHLREGGGQQMSVGRIPHRSLTPLFARFPDLALPPLQLRSLHLPSVVHVGYRLHLTDVASEPLPWQRPQSDQLPSFLCA